MKTLITGGTGSFGRRYAKHLLSNGDTPVIFSRDELKQWEMKKDLPDAEYIIGDVRDYDRVALSMRDVDRVVHAAALKHVATGENAPSEAIATNLKGTENVARAADMWGVDMVLLSTDKAVEPVNAYGATKMLAERITLSWGQQVVRYGNVFGSRGSVLHIFKAAAANGHKFTITDKSCTRFIITFDEAIMVVDDAFASGKPVSVPVLPAIRIVDLALAFDDEAEFEEIGLQHGEKLHEKLSARQSSDKAPKLTVAQIRRLIDESV